MQDSLADPTAPPRLRVDGCAAYPPWVPGTRGFSIRAFVDGNMQFAKRILGDAGRAGDKRAMVSTTKPAARLVGRSR
jgi:hypothetical protein